jgi:quercetin dioxygenase-like cupin family protein
MQSIIYLTFLTFFSINTMAQQKVNRKDLLSEKLVSGTVSKVDVKEITMGPSQTAPLHKHPCPVFGYVAEGTLLFQIQGLEPKTLKQGDAFYEPAETAIAHFDNASSDHSLKFIAFYLNNGENQLIEILPDNH